MNGLSRSRESEDKVKSAQVIFIGEIVQISGVASFVAGLILSLHHWPAAAALFAGMGAFYFGKYLQREP